MSFLRGLSIPDITFTLSFLYCFNSYLVIFDLRLVFLYTVVIPTSSISSWFNNKANAKASSISSPISVSSNTFIFL